MRYEFNLTGTTAMLVHADDVEQSDELMAWRKDPSNKNVSVPGDDRSPGWTWQTYLYTDGANLVVPAENIMVCLRSAGTQLILKRQKTYKEITQSGMFIEQEFCDLLVDGKQIPIEPIKALRDRPYKEQADAIRGMGFRLFAKRARVGTAKHVRVRPRFDTWQIRGMLRVIKEAELSREILERLFEIAGTVGLCDWRPGCKTPGSYGMFEARVKQVK